MPRVKSKKTNGKIPVKRKFLNAIGHLRRMSAPAQRVSIAKASNAFINDLTKVLKHLKKRPHLVTTLHKRKLKVIKSRLRKLIHPKTSMVKKRNILMQRGGIIPVLIPIIAAAIGAAGSVASGAVTAAIMRK